jgi:hypothetical protein
LQWGEGATPLKYLVLISVLAIGIAAATQVQAQTFEGKRGPTTVTGSNKTVTNNGRIKGGSSTGLTVKGSNNTVVNNGTITGSTGVSISGGSSSLVNNGTIKATSKSTSSSIAVGVSQGN